jgi:hypothetical protein
VVCDNVCCFVSIIPAMFAKTSIFCLVCSKFCHLKEGSYCYVLLRSPTSQTDKSTLVNGSRTDPKRLKFKKCPQEALQARTIN